MRAFFIAILLLLFMLRPAWAQQPAAGGGDVPDLSAQMTATQFRHIKLWFAGKLGNWKLAAYELDQLASGLDEAARRMPAGTAPDDTARQVTALRAAIDSKDSSAFTRTYSEL